MNGQIITVFGGTGFLGRHVVRALAAAGHRVRVAARHPKAVDFSDFQYVSPVVVDIRNEEQVREAVAGVTAVVNAVSLYVEKGDLTFDAIHVAGAERVARCAQAAGVARLVHISGIGVDAHSTSAFVRARARGEFAVRDQFDHAVMLRPSVMFGRDDAFLASLDAVSRAPVVPLFGRGCNRLQPAYVKDVATAVTRLCEQAVGLGLYELGGRQVYTYRDLVKTVMSHRGRARPMIPVPFPLWHGLVALLSLLPNPPLTRDQLILMQTDNVVAGDAPGFTELDIDPASLDDLLDECLP